MSTVENLYYDKVTGTYGSLSDLLAVDMFPQELIDSDPDALGFYAELHGKPVTA